jgi:hypothetical protein
LNWGKKVSGEGELGEILCDATAKKEVKNVIEVFFNVL